MICKFYLGCYLYNNKDFKCQDDCHDPQIQRKCWIYQRFYEDSNRYLMAIKLLKYMKTKIGEQSD